MKIVSGGQSGVDRAALDAAIELGIEHGGWCPRGRRAEDGPISDTYKLKETASTEYPIRTVKNIEDSDATLIIKQGSVSPGTAYTIVATKSIGKPCHIVDLLDVGDVNALADLLAQYEIINVAGPRESKLPGVGAKSKALLLEILRITLAKKTDNDGKHSNSEEVC